MIRIIASLLSIYFFCLHYIKVAESDLNIPVIDISQLLENADKISEGSFCDLTRGTTDSIGKACRSTGFFQVSNHGVSVDLIESLETLSREFFDLPKDEKQKISMSKGGKAWRGYFAVGDELTSGIVDEKEGIYFGTEPEKDFQEEQGQKPLHGRNLWPEREPMGRNAVVSDRVYV